jgi:GNAT superfamily N-acetyltransferase
MPKIKYRLIKQCSDEEMEKLRAKLMDFNYNQIGKYEAKKYLFAYYDECDDLIAGLYAYYKLGMFYIDMIWVSERFRLQKIGTELMRKAEQCAIKNKALYIRVDTVTFQALNFYLKNGFQPLAELPLKTPKKRNQTLYYLVKYLPAK